MRRLVGLFSRPGEPLRLHIGSNVVRLDGWVNVDRERLPGVDRVLDVRRGLPWRDAAVDAIFSEHFLEHLSYREGQAFLRECRRVLRPEGVLRASTPNLDWVYETQYHPRTWSTPDEAVRDCFALNKGFRGWGHEFLYNLPALTATIRDAGFAEVTSCRYGESPHDCFRGLEHHEQYVDAPELPHVIIVEAVGRGRPGGNGVLNEARWHYESVAHPRV